MAICVRCAQEYLAIGVLETGSARMALLAVENANAMKVSTEQPVKCVSQGDTEPAVNQVTAACLQCLRRCFYDCSNHFGQ